MTQSVAFDRAASFYDETRGFPPGVEQPIAALIQQVGKLAPSSRVIEIGVGTGRIGLPVAPHVHEYVGVDLAAAMMARLREKLGDTASNIRLIQADATWLPFAADSFDGAIAVHVLHLIPNWHEALNELARVLRPGTPLLHCGGSRNPIELKLHEVHTGALPPQYQDGIGIRRAEHDTFLTEAGWTLIADEQRYEYRVSFIPQQFVTQLEQRIWSRTWRLSDEELAQSVAAVQTYIDREFANPHEPLEVTTGFYVQTYLPPTR